MDKYKKLFSNSIVFTIGSFGSKFISFVMVPLYTNLLTTEQYGTVDLVLTTINLFMPILTLELAQGVLRFAIDRSENAQRKVLYNNGFLYLVFISLLSLLAFPILKAFNVFGDNLFFFILLLIVMMFNNFYSHFIRGIGKVKVFAMNGILLTFCTVIFNILFLVLFNLKIEGYLLSLIIANSISNIYLYIKSNQFKDIDIKKLDYPFLKDIFRYSTPLIPNNIMWWVINGSTRYFILWFLGASANGLFAVANKIPSIISMITSIFTQAWQISSFEEYESNNRNEFYSKIFDIYSFVLFLTSSLILVFLKSILRIMADSSYFDSWVIVPALLFGVIYQSLSGFIGSNYTASMQTKGAFSTSIYGGMLSLILNFLIIPRFGINGVGIATAISFSFMFIIRLIGTRKLVKISVNWLKFLCSNLILVTQSYLLYSGDNMKLTVISLALLLGLILLNRDIVIEGYNLFNLRFDKKQ